MYVPAFFIILLLPHIAFATWAILHISRLYPNDLGYRGWSAASVLAVALAVIVFAVLRSWSSTLQFVRDWEFLVQTMIGMRFWLLVPIVFLLTPTGSHHDGKAFRIVASGLALALPCIPLVGLLFIYVMAPSPGFPIP